MAARGDGANSPERNGEYWLLEKALARDGAAVVMDVGANVGDWTHRALLVAREAATVRVHAFEPAPGARSVLDRRFRLNPSVQVEPYALSNVIGSAPFYVNDESSGTNSMYPLSGREIGRVEVTTLDAYLRQGQIEAVAFAKVDTEGNDFQVLEGASGSLSRGIIEAIQFEYNWRWLIAHRSLRDVFELMQGMPYLFGKLVGNTLEFFSEWHFELDRYFENNYVLIRADSHLVEVGKHMKFDNSNAITVRPPPSARR